MKGATLAVARLATVHEPGAGRDKPVPYGAKLERACTPQRPSIFATIHIEG